MGKSKYRSEEERLRDFRRRYEAEKNEELKSGNIGEVYERSKKNLERLRKKKKIKRTIKAAAIYTGLLLALVLIIVLIILLFKLIFGKSGEKIENDTSTEKTLGDDFYPVPGNETHNDTEPGPTPTYIPVVTPNIVQDASYRGLVVIDPGHGGNDGGAVNGDVSEKDIDLEISLLLRDMLIEYGYTVEMTREDDSGISLTKRASFANSLKDVQAFISIHCNSVENAPEVNGVEVWCYNKPGSKELSESIVEQVSESTGAKNRGVGFKTNLIVTSKTTMPACIVECGYLSGSTEFSLLQQKDYQQRIVNGILVGLDLYLQEKTAQ